LTLWTRLRRFLEHSQLELSNNLAENSVRPVALGRRNWIHIGSEQAGPRVAAILSVVESCRRLQIPIREHLCSMLPGLANFPSIGSQSSRPRLGQIGLGFPGFRVPPRERRLLKRFFVGTDYLFLFVCV